MIFFPIAHNLPHSLAPSLLWLLEVPVVQSYQQVLGLLLDLEGLGMTCFCTACLLLLKAKRLARKTMLFLSP